jgi:hypothetical protein
MTVKLMQLRRELGVVILKIQNIRSSKGTIVNTATNQELAFIKSERWNARELLTRQQTYKVMVEPHVDFAVISAMNIVL